MSILIKRRVLRRLIWFYTVCSDLSVRIISVTVVYGTKSLSYEKRNEIRTTWSISRQILEKRHFCPVYFCTHQAPSDKGSVLNGKCLPLRGTVFAFKVDPFLEGRPNHFARVATHFL